jgi:hypothetical protein
VTNNDKNSLQIYLLVIKGIKKLKNLKYTLFPSGFGCYNDTYIGVAFCHIYTKSDLGGSLADLDYYVLLACPLASLGFRGLGDFKA